MAGYLTAPAHAFFLKCNRKAIGRRETGKRPGQRDYQEKKMIWKRKRDDQGKKCPNKY
jgi:hypothetical protein